MKASNVEKWPVSTDQIARFELVLSPAYFTTEILPDRHETWQVRSRGHVALRDKVSADSMSAFLFYGRWRKGHFGSVALKAAHLLA